MTQWNDPIPDRSTPESRAARRVAYARLDRRGKLLADLRAISHAPGTTATIAAEAADEIELLCAGLAKAGLLDRS